MGKEKDAKKKKEKIVFKVMLSSSDITLSSKKKRVGLDRLLASTDLENKPQSKKIEKRKK